MPYNSEMTNSDRANRAHSTLLTYVEDDGRMGEVAARETTNVEEATQDLICDLIHLLRSVGGEVEGVIRRARASNREELEEERFANQEG